MAEIEPIEVPADAWSEIQKAGGITLTNAEIEQFFYLILMYTHNYTAALAGRNLTDAEADKLKTANKAAAALTEALRNLDFGLKWRLEKADLARRLDGGRSFLSDLADTHLSLQQPASLPEILELLRLVTNAVTATPVRKQAARNLGTALFMMQIKTTFDAAESRECPRATMWRAFFRRLYEALPAATRKALTSEEAAIKQLERAWRSRHGGS